VLHIIGGKTPCLSFDFSNGHGVMMDEIALEVNTCRRVAGLCPRLIHERKFFQVESATQ
jgi:hypothetical protein